MWGDDRCLQIRLILEQFRRSFAEQCQNPVSSAQDVAPTQKDGQSAEATSGEDVERAPVQDPLIYPGLYSPSGFDMMGILVGLLRVYVFNLQFSANNLVFLSGCYIKCCCLSYRFDSCTTI